MFPSLSSVQRVATTATAGRRKAMLSPGHSPMDWAALKTKHIGATELRRITIAELQLHNKKDDCWIAVQGKVFDMTVYLSFHPGGQGQSMRGAGKDATKLFMEIHSWVNIDRLLDVYLIGFLVSA